MKITVVQKMRKVSLSYIFYIYLLSDLIENICILLVFILFILYSAQFARGPACAYYRGLWYFMSCGSCESWLHFENFENYCFRASQIKRMAEMGE